MVVQIVLICMEMGPVVEIANGLKHIRNVYQKVLSNAYRALQGVCRFSLQYLWKRAVRIPEKPSKRKIVYVVGKPVIFTDCGEIL